jgi:hypothetical protein
MKRTTLAMVVAGVLAGAGSGLADEAKDDAKKPCCHPAQSASAPKCPIREGKNGLEATDRKAADRMRRALRDGVFLPWVEQGRAPTPAEFAKRLKLSQPDANALLDEMQACGESVGGGILRVPQSELIAVAWPLANVPTGITVTVPGGKPAFARCAVDALGVSQMLGKKTTVEADARDNGARLKITVDGAELVSAEPAGVAVVKGEGCDNMSFFSSRDAAERWRKAHGGEGELMTLADAVKRGAKIFGQVTAGLSPAAAVEPARPKEKFYCNIDALTSAERTRHGTLSYALRKAVVEKAELPSGYGFRLAAQDVPLVAEWVGYEAKCCPFFSFEMQLARDQGPLWLRITGSEGVKAFIKAEFGL